MSDQSGGGGSPVWLGVALVFVGMVGKDIFTTTNDQEVVSSKSSMEKAVVDDLAGNSIYFQYCYSWGYEKVYRQLAGILQQQFGHEYPDLVINGENYNPGGGRIEISQLIGMAKMCIIGMIMFGFNPWTYLGSDVAGPTPSIVIWALENKIYACLMTFFLCNMVETQLISSGAFEVTVNGDKGDVLNY